MECSRRKFLLGGSAMITTVGLAGTQMVSAEGLDGKNQAMLYDESKCIGCEACVDACRETNKVPEGVTRLSIERTATEVDGKIQYSFMRKSCQHCENAPCLTNCPVKAIERRSGGQVVIDKNACIGCRTCSDVCPFNVPDFDELTNKMEKCTGCYDRVEAGLKQACVAACPTKALISGIREEIVPEATMRVKSYQENLNTNVILYGAVAPSDYTGILGWMTIAPKHLLPATSEKLGMQIRSVARSLGGIGIAATVGGLALHSLFYFKSRKNKKEGDE